MRGPAAGLIRRPPTRDTDVNSLMETLFSPLTVGKLDLPNRLVMGPMTRSRVPDGGQVTVLTAEYYAQRASAGLIISEATGISDIGSGYLYSPGLHTAGQVDAWREVTDAVHAAGGRIFAQLVHCGRIGHPSLYADGALPIAPSPIASGEQLYTPEEMLEHPVPREMTAEDIAVTVEDFAAAARNAIEAGFDGVEIHAANGFLLHQFLDDSTNRRTDAYGGSIANRIRLTEEVVAAVTAAIGPERTGIRVSPAVTINGMGETDSPELYTALARSLAATPLAYVHVAEVMTREITRLIRAEWPGVLLLSPHATEASPATPESGAEALREGLADAVVLARAWLANPDLTVRAEAGGPYTEADPATYYGGDHRGYTDYPTLNG
ncbi:putative oxidoreductase [Streptomyces venezuelae ATCC 10712]|uniref:Putative oxidoreductase n=2 Tax=Streptomyces TaxID=1883 RepID=F2R8W0_STRVP|nr:putative oxidoreductase [Streptomyces venezuelae ATCC 10712]